MLKRGYRFIGIAIVFPSVVFAQDQCGDVLRPALMTVQTAANSTKNVDAYNAWQCSFTFSTHDEALKAGLSVGVPIYGVPLKIGGTWDKSQVDSWKNENCSANARKTSFEGATTTYLTQVAPDVVSEWGTCIQATYGSTALNCEMSAAPYTLSARWRRTAGELDTAAPIVNRFTVSNGTCRPGFPVNYIITDGGAASPCVADDGKDLTVIVETSRGMCIQIAKFPAKVVQIAGIMKLDGDKTLEGDIVEVSAGSKIITNGYYLAISARELRINGDASIVSFEPSQDRSAGDQGESGGTIVIQVDRVTGSRLSIDPRGEDGMKGVTGTKGGTGVVGQHGKGGVWKNLRGCVDRREAGTGGQGLQGGTGGTGGNGGNGGTVTVRAASGLTDGAISRISVVNLNGRTIPGRAGGAGDPGQGGDGGPGGGAASGSGTCGGVGTGLTGPQGLTGLTGTAGIDGAPGTIDVRG